MQKSDYPRGSVTRFGIDSEVLKSNRLGDPTRRDVDVYVPANHDGSGLPLLVDLVGFTAGGPLHTAWKPFFENVPERLDRLIATGQMPPVVVAFPDCFTSLGGNQYVNSSVVGRWEDFLIDEMLPAVETRFGCGGTGRRGVFGKSSGGYGAFSHAFRRPDVWAAAASHSGDAGFDLMAADFPMVLRVLARHELSIESWFRAYETREKHKDEDIPMLLVLAEAASYDPDPSLDVFKGLRLPVDLETCEFIEDRWKNWMACDPVELAKTHGRNIGKLKAFYMDCGTVDQYNLLYGNRRIHRTLKELGIEHTYEEFEDNHNSVDYRMDVSLPFLAKALQ